ncbi:MAG TPA: ABC transporter substrate-binding protein [Candidatus Sulfotelmatobacter sp.]|jgi:peptide/nickel transport system substrate-binding protein|nr:ABC transporter substrate-binding protein [Candidatus Sulfotelmatobacter sp.]
MRFTKSRWLAAISAALVTLICSGAQAAPPRYGGTLHVKLRASSVSLDPREWTPGSLSSAAGEKLASLVFDRLVTLDDHAKFQPALATEWSHDAAARSWQFKLRSGVRFSDGSLLTPADAVVSMQISLGKGFEVTSVENGIVIRAAHSTPDLLEQLASGRNFVFRPKPDGTLLGTGPFFVAESIPAAPAEANPTAIKPAKIKFQANEGAWSGRPFVDFVEVTLGEPPLRQLLDLQVGKADIAEIAPDLVRKARQEGLRIWNSSPQTLVALRFDDALTAPASDQLREALWLALDRDTMANVLLQREAQPADSLLPQWLSGYAFLFESPMNLQRARELRAAFPAGVPGATQPLRLRVDAPGDLFRLMGERVAVNARQANLAVQVLLPANANNSPAPAVGLHLFAWHYDSLSPRAELEAFVKQLLGGADLPATITDPEQLFAQERRLLEERRILPLVLLPEYAGVRANVHNWNASPWGDWRLADVWLDSEDPMTTKAPTDLQKNSSTARNPGARP